jgi:hypothetical protein
VDFLSASKREQFFRHFQTVIGLLLDDSTGSNEFLLREASLIALAGHAMGQDGNDSERAAEIMNNGCCQFTNFGKFIGARPFVD